MGEASDHEGALAPGSLEGPGAAEEPPAVANLLVHGGTPSGDLLAATLVDLAARGHLEIERRAGGTHFYRGTEAPAPDELLPYELRARSLVLEWAQDGAVPASALVLGDDDEVSEWWRALRAEVVTDARARGYVSVWVAWLAGVATVVLGLVAAALLVYGSIHPDSSGARWAAVAFFVAFGLAAYIGDQLGDWVSLSRQGRARASEWHATRSRLDAAHSFDAVPAGGVVVWGRYLAYAVALGIAPEVAADLPVGPDDAPTVWVRRGGTWRLLPVRPRRWWPPGWGRPPWMVGVTGFVLVGSATALLVAIAASDAREMTTLVFAVAIPAAVVGVGLLVVGVADAVADPITLHGTVVGRRAQLPRLGPWRDWFQIRHALVVDDGAHDPIVLRISADCFERVSRGASVSIELTPLLRHVRSVTG